MYLTEEAFFEPFYSIFFFVVGACFGSFANVMIYRIPAGQSIVSPRSHCFSCGKLVAWYDNIPLISWFVLRGRCRHCGARFSIRYFIVELIMSILFLLIYKKFGISVNLVEFLIFALFSVTASFIDLDHMILPDVFTLTGLVLALVGSLINPDRTFLDSVLGMLLGGGFLWAIAYFYYLVRKEEGMGGGDIKLLAWIGALMGWKSMPFVILGSSFLGASVGFFLMIKKKHGLKTAIPFGPYLVVAAFIYAFVGHDLSQWYINLFMPTLD